MNPLAIARMMGSLAGPALRPPGRWDAAVNQALAGLSLPHDGEPPLDPKWPFRIPPPFDWELAGGWQPGPVPDPWLQAAMANPFAFLNPQPLPPIDRPALIRIIAGALAALNPQPLPPGPPERWRLQLVSGIADIIILQGVQASPEDGRQLIGHFVDDLSHREFRWPWRGPRPNWLDDSVLAADLFVIAGRMDGAAGSLGEHWAGEILPSAAERLASVAVDRLG